MAWHRPQPRPRMTPPTDHRSTLMPRQDAQPVEHPFSRVVIAGNQQIGQLVVRPVDLGYEAVVLGPSPVAHRSLRSETSSSLFTLMPRSNQARADLTVPPLAR